MSTFVCILKTVIRYHFRGKLLPSWNLKTHIDRDLMYNKSSKTTFDYTDDDIAKIDFDEIQEYFDRLLPKAVDFSIENGACSEIEIPVDTVSIDTSWFKGIGVAEHMLCELVDRDRTLGSRTIKAEVLTAWSAVKNYGFDRKSDKSSILKLEPLGDTEPIILYFHGGGGTFGSPASYRKFNGQVSIDTQLRCISVDYRKAPKYPFPAQIHDALISFLYMVEKGFKPGNIILMGDSFGGNLVLALLFVLRNFNAHKVRGAIVVSPCPDLTFPSYKSVEENKHYDCIHLRPYEAPTTFQRLLYKPGTKYSPKYCEELKDPLISTTYGDFSDFPSIFIQAGEKEILLDQISDLYERVKAANPEGTVVYDQVEDGIHVPQLIPSSLPAKKSFDSIRKYVEFIKRNV